MRNLSHAIRKFDRFELKYVVPIKAAEQFKQALRAYLVPDEHGDSAGSYYISSLYYDSPDFRFYWEKVDGVKFRRKLRIRHYESWEPLTGDTMVFVEIKQRANKTTQKRRVLLPYRDALQLCDARQVPQHDAEDEEVIDEIYCLLWQYNLGAASVVRYARLAMVGTEYDIGLRVTFDGDLSFRNDRLQLHEPRIGLPLFLPGWVVIEIKVNERIPFWLTDLVAAHNLSLVRVSKYCRSIEVAQNLATTAWRLDESSAKQDGPAPRVAAGESLG